MKNPKGIIIPPSPDEVQKYLLKWDNLGNYVVQEEAIHATILLSLDLSYTQLLNSVTKSSFSPVSTRAKAA